MGGADLPPPPPPRPGTPDAQPEPGAARDRAPFIVVLVALVLLVAAVGGLVVVLQGGDEPPADLSRRPVDGSAVYRVTAEDQTAPTEEAPGGSLDIGATITLDSGATATEVRIADVVARYQGEPIPLFMREAQTLRFDEQNVPDTVLLIGSDRAGTFYYFVDMLFPVVPTGSTSEGASWPVSFEASLPAATGSATYEGTGELLGYDEIEGTNAAQVRNELTFEYDYEIIASEAAMLAGGSASTGTIGVSGTGSMTVIGWIDPATGVVLRSEIVGSYDVVFAYRDFPTEESGNGNFPSSGEFNVTLELQTSG